ncbi:hypothetical protein ATW97_07255 [Oenococcus oeni]|uniref:hypothetical protein n=1 Tax=Oenococcus oeni TaxID=1247 RepID=UPI0004ABEFF6|nr:hypothetical protein [Oenococcus oeni]KEP87356.1 hypothetical protein X279_07465 [Oenococcus oeni IOEB_0501]OIL34703.1 hypothetical protein ATX10_07525 [Oenococcus oeni]OIM35084.1 hypothetical protein ATX70_07420 [Oenococcus oeni]OIM58125.1 hypothetical protein ATX85_09545 [Oenococcus oeni]OLQ30091.1 hypothetical protein ATW97_07255 [Oenococcus oeni]
MQDVEQGKCWFKVLGGFGRDHLFVPARTDLGQFKKAKKSLKSNEKSMVFLEGQNYFYQRVDLSLAQRTELTRKQYKKLVKPIHKGSLTYYLYDLMYNAVP